MKKYLKKTAGLFVGAAMLLASAMPVFGSTGRINVKSYSDVVKSYSTGESVSAPKDVQVQLALNLTADTDSKDTWGAISFKVKGDVNNTEDDKAIFCLDGRETAASSDKVQIQPVAIMNGRIGIGEKGSWTMSSISKGAEYVNDRWYNVGIVVKKDGTTDCYIDGEYINTTSYNNKRFADNTGVFRLLMNPTGGEDTKFYVKGITWSKYADDGFVGEIVSNTVQNGGEAKIKFTELLTGFNKDDIKVYNCATSELVSGTEASAEDNVLSVQMPTALKTGSEYRIEFGTVKGVFGKSPANDNVYFNCPSSATETEDVIAYETFEGYTKSLGNSADIKANGNYYQPEGWYLKDRWAALNKVSVEPATEDTEHGTSVKIARTDGDDNQWHQGGIYLPLNQTVSSGKLSISFDVNPKILPKGSQNALSFMVYPQALTEEEMPSEGKDNSLIDNPSSAKIRGRMIWAIRSYCFANPTAKSGDYNWWKPYLNSTGGTVPNPQWHKIKIDLDFDANKATWYWNDSQIYEMDDFKSSLKLTGGTGEDLSQVAGISFSVASNVKEQVESLIDNVKVTKTVSSGVSAENSIFSDDFNAFENESGKGQKLWDGDGETIADGYIPNGWAVKNISPDYDDRKTGSLIHSSPSGKSGNALEIGKLIKKAESPVAYHALDKEYTDGILNISYDLNAETLATDTATSKRSFYMMLAPKTVAGTGALGSNDVPGVGESWTYGSENLSKYIFGIQNAKFAAFNTKMFDVVDAEANQYTPKKYKIDGVEYLMGANYRKDVELNQWYNIRHTVDLTGKTVKTYIDGNLVSVASTDALNISQVGGVIFAMDANSYESKLLIDNVSVTSQSYEMSNGGVMQVRFSDYYNNSYGAATTLTTLADTVAVAFWTNTVDTPSDTNFSLTDANGKAIGFNGGYDSASDTYIMNLDEYLTKDTEYTLAVSGLTSKGVALPDYTQKIKSEENGELIVEPITMWKNAAGTDNPVLADSGTLAQGDTVIAKTRVINTTGEEKSFAFSMAMFDDENRLMNFDCSPEIKLDGKSDKNNKEANLLCSFKMSEQDAADYARVKAFLWDGIASLMPVAPSKTFTKTAE
ncbi:MAG: hypothetical protein SPH44_07450 [Eubacteriales bacterium]|nr:hypothetical protein [Eubacteriales bacterium]